MYNMSSKKTNKHKKNKPKVIDLLDEDKPIANQKYVCVSFISPEKIIQNRDQFYFKEFLKFYEINKSTEKFSQFLDFLSYKYNLKIDDLLGDFKEFIEHEKDEVTLSTISDDYKNFIDKNEENLLQTFNKEVDFQTSVRGLKIRGVFPSIEEAEMRCKLLREIDPNHDILVGPVGIWMPWDPDAYKTGRTEYLEPELNRLMHEKHKNEEGANQEFNARVKEAKMEAIKKNKELANETGNKLTQDVDEDGMLYKVTKDGIRETLDDIKEELENVDDVVIPNADDDHGLSNILSKNNQQLTTKTDETSATDTNALNVD